MRSVRTHCTFHCRERDERRFAGFQSERAIRLSRGIETVRVRVRRVFEIRLYLEPSPLRWPAAASVRAGNRTFSFNSVGDFVCACFLTRFRLRSSVWERLIL